MIKSQVNALLHVTQGLLKDAQAAYPALRESFLKDFRRLTLICQNRGLGVFTLDLPSLESILLNGLETGRLCSSGPLSREVSKKVRVPRLYSGLWLRIFDKSACLKQEADVNALSFLRQLLAIGKKLEVGCGYNRVQSTVGAYHDIERGLRIPSLFWNSDTLYSDSESSGARALELDDDTNGPSSTEPDLFAYVHPGICHCGSFPGGHFDFLHGSALYAWNQLDSRNDTRSESLGVNPMSVHLVQACDYSLDNLGKSFPLYCGSEIPRVSLEDQGLLYKIQQVADLIVASFDSFDPVSYSADLESESKGVGFKHGPGAVADRQKGWEKSHFTTWPLKLQATFPFETCGKTSGNPRGRPLNHELASRLICVPKTSKSPRLIAAEPASHQWCQQAVLGFLFYQCKKLFKHSFIDFSNQSRSADMVLKASLDRSLATVDLSDASDRLSCWTVERMFRSNKSILLALHAARTRYIRDEISEYPSFLLIKKFASQGTATTFPIMSLVMLIISLGSCIEGEVTWKNIWKLRDQVRIFGDDIIIPTSGYVRLLRAMELLQLKVNVAKSYVNGHFRESCGTDGFKGYDVTPVKPKCITASSPASCQAVLDTTNNLFNKGFWNASTACKSLLPPRVQRGLRIVGPHDAGLRGFTSFSGSYESHLKQRWNPSLHRFEVRVWSLLLRTHKKPRDGYSTLLDFFASKHNTEHARIVSNFVDIRKARDGFLWEPASCHARVSD